MSNLPGYDLADHIVRTWSTALTSQIRVYNDAWRKIESGAYDVKNLVQDYAKVYRNHYEAYRGVATFGVRSVEWQQKTVGKGAKDLASFEIPGGTPFEQIRVSRADRTGGPDPKGGQVKVTIGPDKRDGLVTIVIDADKKVQQGDQWIAFVFDKTGGPPLGALLIHIGP